MFDETYTTNHTLKACSPQTVLKSVLYNILFDYDPTEPWTEFHLDDTCTGILHRLLQIAPMSITWEKKTTKAMV